MGNLSALSWQAQLVLDARKEMKLRKITTKNSAFADFGERYFDDPASYLVDCVNWPMEHELQGPAEYQLEAAGELVESLRVAMRGGRGLGKTALAALLVLWFALTREAKGIEWKALTTASAWAQLILYLWPEIHVWARRLKWDVIGRGPLETGKELLKLSLTLGHGYAAALASNDPAKMEGGHSPELLFVFDEAKVIPDATWDAMEGAFSGSGKDTAQRAYVLAISSPGDPTGRFYDIHSRKPGFEDWRVKHVTLEEILAAGRMSRDWVDNRRRQWGEESSMYKNQVLGEFAQSSAAGLIQLAWIDQSNLDWQLWDSEGRLRPDGRPSVVTQIGVDVGGGSEYGDKSVIALVYDGHIVGDLIIKQKAEDPTVATMELAALVLSLASKYRQATVTVDGLGIGAGMLHWLRTQGCHALSFMAGSPTTMMDDSGLYGYVNWRSAGWHGLSYLLSPLANPRLWIPPDEALQGELLAMRAGAPNLRNQRPVIGKDEIRKTIGGSTDRADAIMHAIMGPLLTQADEVAETEQVVRPIEYRIGNY